MSEVLKFPPGFLWGSAVSSYQVEGGINNCDWSKNHPAGKACDYYNRYEKYFDLALGLGQNAHRFSIEWSRIEPEEGKFDREAIEHYKKMLLALKARNMKTMVTIWHWTNPAWFSAKGGWQNHDSVRYFLRFIDPVVRELGDLVDFWMVFNEPMVYVSLGYILGTYPPYKKDLLTAGRVYLNFSEAHKKAYGLIHKLQLKARVGIAYNSARVNPARLESKIENIGSECWQFIRNHMYLDSIKNHLDFVGINYYFRDTIRFNPSRFPYVSIDNKNENCSDMGWEIFPEGIYSVVKDVAKRYKVPIYITENGIADAKDAKRAQYIADHLAWLYKAIEEGVDIRGYFYWSLMDNFEWLDGYNQKFGLIEMNFDTLEAKIRPSAYRYAEICKNNSLAV